MTTEVIILAQGTQQRLGPGVGYKQLLPLPACYGAAILMRTLRQLFMACADSRVTLITWRDLFSGLWDRANSMELCVDLVQLPDPGNSSLKGIARYLELPGVRADKTIVLLGDVVYSWKCLDAIWACSATSGFVGTRDVSSSTGEIWGVAWHREHADAMMDDLRDALLRHPPFEDEYQPGQLRRWIVGMRRGELAFHVANLTHKGRYLAIDDYTMDVDVAGHIPKLGEASVAAAKDDAAHGMVWTPWSPPT